MKRRLFLHSSSAAAATAALTACGGGGGGAPAAATAVESSAAPAAAAAPVANVAAASAAPVAATPVRVAGVAYPFGARLDAYVAGTLPSQTKPAMDALLTKQYDAWKAANVVPADSIVAGGLAVQFSGTGFLAVSEGMGYGMLLAVLFAGHDPKARTLFDGLLSVVRARPAYATGKPALMEWKLYSNGTSAGEGYNAMDGDEDIAMALLMADRQWGSEGKWNYKAEAIATINAMKAQNMKDDGTTKGLGNSNNNRTSDYMIGHFRAYKKATGDALWDRAVDRSYELLDIMQTRFSPGVGLMPDFVINTNTSTPAPSTGFIGDNNDREHLYHWNACRNPWRFASDYLLTGDARFASVTGKLIDFFQSSSGGNPTNIGTGYQMDGTQVAGGTSAAFVGPICAGACVDKRFQSFVDATWDWNARNLTTGYYGAELQLLSMVVASGNWWTP